MLLLIGVGAMWQQDGGKLVLDDLIIRDEESRKRIWLNGSFVELFDANEKLRISAGTFPDALCRAMLNRTDDVAATPAIQPLQAVSWSLVQELHARHRRPV